jgi:hypothetical protein
VAANKLTSFRRKDPDTWRAMARQSGLDSVLPHRKMLPDVPTLPHRDVPAGSSKCTCCRILSGGTIK